MHPDQTIQLAAARRAELLAVAGAVGPVRDRPARRRVALVLAGVTAAARRAGARNRLRGSRTPQPCPTC